VLVTNIVFSIVTSIATRIVTRKPLMILLSFFVIVTSASSLFVYGSVTIPYLEQVQANYDNYNNSLWSLGNGIAEGDYFQYKICNDDTIQQRIYPYHCYEINLEFVTILTSYNGDVWVVQGNLITPDISQQMIFLINPDTFQVSTDKLNVDLGNSISDTIFSLSSYGVQSLSIGTVWDEIDSYFTNKIPLEIKNKQSIQIFNGTIETSVLSYDIVIPSNIYLHNDFPFPLKAVTYSPNIIYPEPQEEYYFELLEFGNSSIQNVLTEDFPIP